jgi:hypothetical protein
MNNHTHTQYTSIFCVETQCGRKPHNVFSYLSLRITFIGSVGNGSHSLIAAGAELDAHQFMSRFVYGKGDRMEVNSNDIVSTLKLVPARMGR